MKLKVLLVSGHWQKSRRQIHATPDLIGSSWAPSTAISTFRLASALGATSATREQHSSRATATAELLMQLVLLVLLFSFFTFSARNQRSIKGTKLISSDAAVFDCRSNDAPAIAEFHFKLNCGHIVVAAVRRRCCCCWCCCKLVANVIGNISPAAVQWAAKGIAWSCSCNYCCCNYKMQLKFSAKMQKRRNVANIQSRSSCNKAKI